jgi:DNA helicase-2/ATP-dependent DNA helicase PcrA
MIAFSPNRTFATYIASVLPDLNEGQIRQIILHQFIVDQLGRLTTKVRGRAAFRIESSAQQFEAALGSLDSPGFAARRQSCLFKASRAMMDLIEEFAAKREQEIEERFTDLEYPSSAGERSLFFTHTEMLMLFRQAGRHGESMAARCKSVVKSVSTRISEAARQPTTASRTIESLRAQLSQIDRSLAPLLEMNGLDAYAAIWSDREALSAALTDPGLAITVDQIADETLDSLQDRQISAEDVAPILLLDGLLNGFRKLENTDHVVVDEAQDYTLLHFEYIKRCLPESCTWTIVGDMRQATNPLLSLEVYTSLDSVFTRSIEHLKLTTSYRSSYEINEFTGRILPGDARPEGIRRTTVKPTLVAADDPAMAIAAILGREQAVGSEGSTAIICRTTADSVKLHAALKSRATVSLVTDETNDLPPGTYILPIRLAKGLEIDTVILHDAGTGTYRHQIERRILYTACSRALHRLYLCHSGAPSPLLPLDEPELYTSIALEDLSGL